MMPSQQKNNERNEAEEPACELLQRLGYRYVPREQLAAERDNEREVLLKGRLLRALLRINPWLSEDQAERAIFKLQHVEATGMARNRAVREYLTYGLPLEVNEPAGRRTRTVHFFDFDYPEPRDGRNEYLVTRQMRVRRGNERNSTREDDERLVIPDLVLFVNGIPLVVIEAKSNTLIGDLWKARAVRQLLRYQEAGAEWRGRGAPELFDYNLLCVALCGGAAAYGAIGAPENEYPAWKTVAPLSQEEARACYGDTLEGQGRLIAGLLSPAVLLDILRDFVVYAPEKGRLVKKLPRYQQYRAVTAAMRRILRNDQPEQRGGVIWHTQGSGKSLTLLWLATKLRREPRLRNPTILLVTDRTQLDEQITRTFERCGFAKPDHASSARALREQLSSGYGRTISTTIQKFEEALNTAEGPLELLNAADNVFVMVDEAHRTQYGSLAARMRKALPAAVFIGFTGTPIDKAFGRTTMGKFGPLFDSYTIPQAVQDGATVPIYYEARLPDLSIQGPNTIDRLFETMFGDQPEEVQARIRRRYANKETLAEAERRIEMIAEDIARHFKEHVRPDGFKAQVVAPSRLAAIHYAERLRDFGIEESYPIITVGNDDGAEYNPARLDQKDLISRFTDLSGSVEILVVVDMLLTG
ncbi:MAG: type I restriction endonuclease subunit R, partial [Dehalococcoidia bacterium]